MTNKEKVKALVKELFEGKEYEDSIREAAELSAKDQREMVEKSNRFRKEKLFEAVYEACPELKTKYIGVYGKIQLSHLLRTAKSRGKKIVIDVWGNVMEIIGENECGINLNTPVCRVNLTKSIENQEEDTLIQLAKVIL